MSGAAGGNVPPWFATVEELAIARRWALASGLATLLVWWFREQAFTMVLLLLLYQLFLAIRSYAVTGRRRFLVVPAVPLVALLGLTEHHLVLLGLGEDLPATRWDPGAISS